MRWSLAWGRYHTANTLLCYFRFVAMGTDANDKKEGTPCIFVKALHKHYLLMHTWCMGEANTENVRSPYNMHSFHSHTYGNIDSIRCCIKLRKSFICWFHKLSYPFFPRLHSPTVCHGGDRSQHQSLPPLVSWGNVQAELGCTPCVNLSSSDSIVILPCTL